MALVDRERPAAQAIRGRLAQSRLERALDEARDAFADERADARFVERRAAELFQHHVAAAARSGIVSSSVPSRSIVTAFTGSGKFIGTRRLT